MIPKSKKIKAANYTAEMVDVMRSHAPLDAAKCATLAESFGKSVKSVIAKAAREGIPYNRKIRTTKTGGDIIAKQELIKAIAKATNAESEQLAGLSRSPKTTLSFLLTLLP